jgi:beta-lactamase superfamily II metal-dependent hydrolase
MYRHGLGDCHLLRLPKKGGGDFVIMIDCGVILGTPDAPKKMTDDVKDIKSTTGGVIDVLVITHEHWDHLSGFLQAAKEFQSGLKVRSIWFAWTEDPKNPLARKLRKEREQALAALGLAAQRLALGAEDDAADAVQGIIDFFGAAGGTTKDALAAVRKLSNNVRYCQPQDAPITVDGVSAKFYVLGPPMDERALKKTLPSKAHPETYGLDQLALDIGPSLTEDSASPFSTLYAIPEKMAQSVDFFQQHYWKGEAWRRIDSAWLTEAADLALQLDSATNNTSLVLAIELEDGNVLLFAADAQVGNWLSWQDLKWQEGTRQVTGPELLAKTVFYKVGHHGSHNATLRQFGLELMTNLSAAVIPVDEKMAKKKRWGHMPLKALVEALSEKTNGFVLRSDAPAPKAAKNTTENPLYFEVTI